MKTVVDESFGKFEMAEENPRNCENNRNDTVQQAKKEENKTITIKFSENSGTLSSNPTYM
jgi:hypothetical protein